MAAEGTLLWPCLHGFFTLGEVDVTRFVSASLVLVLLVFAGQLVVRPAFAQDAESSLVGLRQIGVTVFEVDSDDTFCGIDWEQTRQTTLLALASGGLAATDYENALWDPEFVVFFITYPVANNTECVTYVETYLQISNTVVLPSSENFRPPSDAVVRVRLWDSHRLLRGSVSGHGAQFYKNVEERISELIADWKIQNGI